MSTTLYHCTDGAAFEKNRIEELQRAARKDRKKRSDEFTPRSVQLTCNTCYNVNPVLLGQHCLN